MLPILGGELGAGHVLTSVQIIPYNLGWRTGCLKADTLRGFQVPMARRNSEEVCGTVLRDSCSLNSFLNDPEPMLCQNLSGSEGPEAMDHIQRWLAGGVGCGCDPALTICTLTSLAKVPPANLGLGCAQTLLHYSLVMGVQVATPQLAVIG